MQVTFATTELATKLYEEQQSRSQQALKLYQDEKSWNDNFMRISAKQVMQHIYRLTDVDIYTNPVQALKKATNSLDALMSNREDEIPHILFQQRAYIYFIRCQFSKVIESPFNHGSLLPIAQELSKVHSEGSLISPETFQKMIDLSLKHQYGHFGVVLEKMLSYDAAVRNNSEEHSQIIYAVLKHKNRQWKQQIFEFSKKQKHLRISGSKLHSLGIVLEDSRSNQPIHYCYLSGLKLTSLDLSNTDVYNLNQIASLKLKKLNISNTLVTDLSPLKQLTSLQELTISKNQFPADQLKQLPSSIKIAVSAK